MKGKTFRQRVVESTLSLPITAMAVAVLWMLPQPQDLGLWAGLAWAAVMTYIIVEWNNQYQLLRIRSRMNSITFMSLLLAFPFLHHWAITLLPAGCLLLSYFLLFRTYGHPQPQGYVFYAFLLLGIASLQFPPLLMGLPFLYFTLGRQLRAITRQSLSASCFGLLLPYIGLLTYWSSAQQLTPETLRVWWASLSPELTTYLHRPLSQWVTLGFLSLLNTMSVLHFVRTAFNDKIRTRQYYYFLLIQQLPLWTLVLLFPSAFELLLPLIIVHITPFVSHYFALARGRGLSLWFSFWICLLVILGLCNTFDLWTLSYTFL